MPDEFVGYREQLLKIKEIITHPRESSVINIVGAYGSGRSSLLDYIQDRLTNKAWKMPQDEDPIVVFIDGQGFVKQDKLMPFLAQQINLKLEKFTTLVDLPSANAEDPVTSMVDHLRRLSVLDYPIIILIDNFTRILTRIQNEQEVQDLNQLKFSGIHYILVTDSRSVHEIAPGLANVSDFLRTAQHVAFPPLSLTESLGFIQKKIVELQEDNAKQPCKLTDSASSFIYELAGGHSGLLYAILKRIYFDHCRHHAPNGNGLYLDRKDIDNEKFLRYLPEDESVKYYLNNLIASVDFLESDAQKQFLVDIVMGNLNKKEHSLLRLDTAFHKRLNVMGFLADPSQLEVGGKLLQYGILTQVIPAGFSSSEATVLNALVRARPGLVTFEQLTDIIKAEAKSDDDDTLRSLADSTIARIRRKLDQIPNHAAFIINNVRGRGFYMMSPIPFDVFMSEGASVFSQGILEAG